MQEFAAVSDCDGDRCLRVSHWLAVCNNKNNLGGCKLTAQEWKVLQAADISGLPAAEQQRRLEHTEMWYQSGLAMLHLGMIVCLTNTVEARRRWSPLLVAAAGRRC